MFVLCKCLIPLRKDVRNVLFAALFTLWKNMLATTSNGRSCVLRVLPSEIHAAGRHVHWPFCYLSFFALCVLCNYINVCISKRIEKINFVPCLRDYFILLAVLVS